MENLKLTLPANIKPGDLLLIKKVSSIDKTTEASVVKIDTMLSEAWDKHQQSNHKTGAVAANMVQQIYEQLDAMQKSRRNRHQAERIASAKARGSKFGRKPLERLALLDSIREQWQEGEISAREAAKQLGISHVTFLAWMGKEQTGVV